MKSIIIFGGSGYVGKNLIRSFVKKGYKIIIPYQKQIDDMRFMIERAFSTAYKKS